MESMRSTWTDQRLDDFAVHTDQRFDIVDKRFDAVDRRFDSLERRMDAGFTRVDGDIRELRGEIGGLNRTIFQVGAGMIGTMVVAFGGLIATQL
jgi:hypothetical protein